MAAVPPGRETRGSARRGGRPLGTPLALSVCPGVSASQARSELLFSLRGQGGGVRRGGEAAGRRTAAARGCHPSGGRPASPLRTVRPGAGLMQPRGSGSAGTAQRLPGPIPWPCAQVSSLWEGAGHWPVWVRTGSRKPGRRLGAALWLPRPPGAFGSGEGRYDAPSRY